MSRKWSGFIRCSRSRIPPLSNRKMPFVSPRQKTANVLASSSGKRSGSIRLLRELDRFGQNREVAQAEKVHLEQTGAFDVAHRPLGNNFRFAFDVLQRH